MDIYETNWEEKLEEGETASREVGGKTIEVVLLTGLQRLARQAGLVSQRVEIITPAPTMVQAIVTATFSRVDDEAVTFSGAADCNAKNTSAPFNTYPTAVAESRAEARCLKKALGIRMLSSEEVGFQEVPASMQASGDNDKAPANMIAAIEKLCDDKGVDVVVVLEQVLDDSRASSIFELSELTTSEARAAMGFLNDKKVSKRSKRKQELQGK